ARAVQVGAGRRAAAAADDLAEEVDAGERGGVGDAEHAVDDRPQERGLDARAADALDAGAAVDGEAAVAGVEVVEVHGALGVDDADLRREAAVARVAAERGGGAAGAGAA